MNKKFKTLWMVFTRSISEPSYYNDVIKAPISFSLKYFFVFYFFFGMVAGLGFAVKFIPRIDPTVDAFIAHAISYYPDELAFDIKEGELSVTGVELPYFMEYPQFDEFGDTDQLPKYFVVIDPSTNERADALVTLGKDKAIIANSGTGSSYEEFVYQDIEEDISFNKETINTFIPEFSSFIKGAARYIPLIVAFAISFILPFGILVFLLFLTALIWIVHQFSQQTLSYKKLYQMGLHVITFAEIARFLQQMLFSSYNLPSVYTWAYFAAMFLALWNIVPQKQLSKKSAQK